MVPIPQAPARRRPSIPTRVLVVSDSHLSSRTPEAVANWDAVVAHVAAGDHDVVVHVGDITADGAARDGDLAVARDELARLGARLRAVPGNHDLGENPFGGVAGTDTDPYADVAAGHERPVSAKRLRRYRDHLGPDRWALDVPGWRIVGANGLLFGSVLEAEADQWAWLADVLPAPDRRVALVLHKPLEPPPPGTDVAPHRYTPPAAVERLRALLPGGGDDLGLVVSGHVHQHVRYERDGTTYLWAPTTWAVLPDRLQPVLGDKTCGVVELDLHGDGTFDSALARPAALAHHVLLDTIPSPY